MKRIFMLSLVVLISFLHVPASAENELTPENTVICSNETDTSFCRDFSVLLRRVKPLWTVLDTAEVPEPFQDENLIIIGELDAEYTGDIIKEFLTQKETDHIKEGNYSILTKENPWKEDKIIYICTGLDKLLVKKAAEEFFTSLEGDWILPPFSSVPREKIQKYLTEIQYVPEEDEIPKEMLKMEVNAKSPAHISADEAAEDVEYLFYLLSHGYCGYGFFKTRGDFDGAKDAVLKELETKSTWAPDDLSQLFHDHLSFVRDCHLKIGPQKYGVHKDFWYNTDLEFWKSMGKYYFVKDNTEYQVISVEGEDPDHFMYPSLNAQGDPVYRFGLLSYTAPEPLAMAAHTDNEQHQFELTLDRSDFSYFSEDIFQEDIIGGIPVVRIRSFSDHHSEHISKFIETAAKYRNEPCLIIDLRGNGGGNEQWPKKWITRFTGKSPSSKRYFTELITKTTMMGRVNYFEYLLDMYPDTSSYQTEINQYTTQADAFENQYTVPHWTGPFSQDASTIPNTTTVIVVMNGKAASAGEGFINYIQQLENVVFVGENSAGALVFGQVTYHRLPHSALLVRLPISLNIPIDLEFREERGFFPDLWIPAGDALNYAVAAVRKGTITTVQPLPEEILQEKFKPEEQPILETKEIVLLLPIIPFGIVFILANRNKGRSFFVIAGICWGVIGVVTGVLLNPILYMYCILGVVSVIFSLYKWRKEN